MAHDKNISPVDWYVGSYLLRFMELRDPERNDPDARFLSWENTILVRAKSFDEAYAKVVAIGKDNATRYRGGSEGVPVKWQYVGVTELLPVYDEIRDGAEIAWAEHSPRALRNLRKSVKTKQELKQ